MSTLRWRPADGIGLEHLDIRETADGIVAASTVIGTFEGFAYGARYEVRLAPDWTFRALRLERTDGAALALDCENGAWSMNGAPAPQFAGCIDIDISATPFTNTLPIRRVPFEPRAPRRFDMAWVPLDSLAPFVDGQIYTMRDATHFRYEAADGSFEAELTLDRDGFVLHYPGLYERA
jgi:hypothetical protein